jgi:hypothetical protein
MAVEIITKEDLKEFRIQLLNELRQLLSVPATKQSKEWLKGTEVRRLMGISAGTLQSLRIQGTLHPSKIGGIYYYRYEEIQRLLESKKG